MNDKFQHKTNLAIFWSLLEMAGIWIIHFSVGIALARLLLPSQFGLIGMLNIFIIIAQTLSDFGFQSALIQKKNATEIDSSSVFYFNIFVGFIIAVVLCAIAPMIAEFYKEPELASITRALSLVVIFNSFGLIHYTLINKEINFKTLTKVNVISNIISGVAGIVLAIKGYGVWSLVFQQISRACISTSLLWIFNKWRPSLKFSIKSLKELFSFGSNMVASSILFQVFDNLYNIIIGRVFSASDLGFFKRAYTIQEIPSSSLASMVGRVIFPVFSILQDDKVRVKNGMKKALIDLTFITLPIMIGIALLAKPIILILYTEKWAQAIPYLQLLSVVGLLVPIQSINLYILQALGRSDLYFRLEIIKNLLIVINIIITWHFGILVMIYGILVLQVISVFLNSAFTGFLIHYGIFEQLFDLLPYMFISLLMMAGILITGFFVNSNLWLVMIIKVIVGGVIYIGSSILLRLEALIDIWSMIVSRIPALESGFLNKWVRRLNY